MDHSSVQTRHAQGMRTDIRRPAVLRMSYHCVRPKFHRDKQTCHIARIVISGRDEIRRSHTESAEPTAFPADNAIPSEIQEKYPLQQDRSVLSRYTSHRHFPGGGGWCAVDATHVPQQPAPDPPAGAADQSQCLGQRHQRQVSLHQEVKIPEDCRGNVRST